MPIFDFECKTCGKIKEELQKIEDPSPVCDDATHGPMDKLITLKANVRKGAGLYSLDVGLGAAKFGDLK